MGWNTQSARLAVLLTAILWSSGGLIVKITACPPIPLTGLRCLFSLVLFYLVFRKELSFRFNTAQWLGALAYCSMAVCYTVATKWTTAANAILLQYTAPVFVALLSSWLLKEKLNKTDWFVVCIIMFGMVLFFFDKTDAGGMWGNIVAVASGVSYALFIVFTRMEKDGSPIGTIVLGNIIGLIISLPFFVDIELSGDVLAGGMYFGLIYGGLAYILYSKAIRYVSALTAILIATVEPILNPLWVFLVVGEIPSMYAVAGGTVVITTLLIKNIYDIKRSSNAKS